MRVATLYLVLLAIVPANIHVMQYFIVIAFNNNVHVDQLQNSRLRVTSCDGDTSFNWMESYLF